MNNNNAVPPASPGPNDVLAVAPNANNDAPLGAIVSNLFDIGKEGAWKIGRRYEGIQMPTALKNKVLNAMVELFYTGWKKTKKANQSKTKEDCAREICVFLKETGTIVSGGFILHALGLFRGGGYKDRPDIDIYTNVKNVITVYTVFSTWFEAAFANVYNASRYCSSFMRRNGIRRVYTFDTVFVGGKQMDIMAVRNSRKVTDVVLNFDLTFCENWFDGDYLYSAYPEHLDHKIGYLQGDYVPIYLGKNQFLQRRVNKYAARGFDIRLDPAEVAKLNVLSIGSLEKVTCEINKPVRDDAFYYKWASKALFQYMWYKQYTPQLSKQHPEEINFSKEANSRFSKGKVIKLDDGYDSDDYELSSPTDPRKADVQSRFTKLAAERYELQDKSLAPLTDEEKFWHTVTRCISYFHSNKKDSPFLKNIWIPGNNENQTIKTPEEQLQYIFSLPSIKRCLDALKTLFTRQGMDPVTLDDVQVYDFHAHKLDQGAGTSSLDELLTTNINIANKDEIPCYITAAEGCGRYLTRDDVRPFTTPAKFMEFVSTKPPLQMIPLGELTDWGALLRNDPSSYSANAVFGSINKETMCPFCLRQETRSGGCTYMQHEHSGSADLNKMPYCDRREQVKELFEKYQAFRKALPLEAWGDHQGLEYCAICGRPCYGHDHFDLQNPGQIIKSISDPNNPAISQYGVCKGGGRPELIARMLAIRAVLLKHKGDAEPNHAEIRKEAAFAADAAPLDPALMARAKAIFAKEAKSRKFNNVGLNDDSSNGGPPGGPGGRGNNNSEEKTAEEGDEGPVVINAQPAAVILRSRDEIANKIRESIIENYEFEEQYVPEPPAGEDRLNWYRALRKYLDYYKSNNPPIPPGWNPVNYSPNENLEEIGGWLEVVLVGDIVTLLDEGGIFIPAERRTPPEGEDPIPWYEALRDWLEELPAEHRLIPEGWYPGMPHALPALPPANAQLAVAAVVANAPPANAQPAAPQNWAAGLNPGNFVNNNAVPNNLQGGNRRTTRGRRKSAMKKRLRTQRNGRR